MGIATNTLCFPISSPGRTVLKHHSQGFQKFQRSQTPVNHSDGQLNNKSTVFHFFLLHSLVLGCCFPKITILSKLCIQALTLFFTFKSTQYKTFGIRYYFSNSRDVNNWFINYISKVIPFQANLEVASKSLGFLKIFPTKELFQPKELSFTTFPV